MKRGHGLICTAVVLCLSMTACASIPELSESDQKKVTEYAASLVLKYDSENHSRLVDVNDYITRFETATRLYNQAEEAYYAAIEAEKEQRIEETKEQERLNEEYAKETTPTVDISEDQSAEFRESDLSSTPRVSDSMSVAEFLGYGDFSIDYAGFDVLSEYPASDDDVSVTLDATKGSQLLVLYFNVTNNSSEDKELDILSTFPTFKISVNGDKYYSALKTILEDDMAVYAGAFGAGETKRLVLIKEIMEGIRVTTLDMRVSHGEDSLTKSLE